MMKSVKILALLQVALVAMLLVSGCRTSPRPLSMQRLSGNSGKKTAISQAPATTKPPTKAPASTKTAVVKESAVAPAPIAPENVVIPAPAEPIKVSATDTAPAARLRAGLVVNVNVLVAGKKEIEAESKRVTDQGTLVMPLLGVVMVKELTLAELADKLTKSYEEYYVGPQVIVEFVRDDNNEGLSPWGAVTVLGRVKKPGKVSIPATRDLTLSAAIQQAGGFDTSAKETAIRVTRKQADGTTKIREVNLHSVGAQGITKDDILLEQDDVVFVPELVF